MQFVVSVELALVPSGATLEDCGKDERGRREVAGDDTDGDSATAAEL